MKNINGNRGFTLVEMLVAVTLLAIGILAVVQMQVVGMRSSTFANKITVATALAQEVMDDVQSEDVNNISAATNASYDFVNGFPNSPVGTDGQSNVPGAGNFRAFYTIIQIPPDNNTVSIVINLCVDESSATADAACGNVAGRRRVVSMTSVKRIV